MDRSRALRGSTIKRGSRWHGLGASASRSNAVRRRQEFGECRSPVHG